MSDALHDAERAVDRLYMSWRISTPYDSDRHRAMVRLVRAAIEADEKNCGCLGGELSDALFAVCGDKE